MTTDRELMQQALDALEQMAKEGWLLHGPEGMDEAQTKCIQSLEALRARLAQPEQEPVAKMREMLEVQGRDGNWNYDAYMQGMYNGMEFMVALAEGRDPVFRGPPEKWIDPPPQREWQGLTDEEAAELAHAPIAEIEAKLKEKNT